MHNFEFTCGIGILITLIVIFCVGVAVIPNNNTFNKYRNQVDSYKSRYEGCKTKTDIESLYNEILENTDFYVKKYGKYYIKSVSCSTELKELMYKMVVVYEFLNNIDRYE